ncbi:MAG: agmatinase [Aigarchaeota archaeon]|nr:agmatinase [Candidatus Pelearchaeum maunauluense]
MHGDALKQYLRRSETFLGLEYSLDEAKYVAFGVPYDLTSSFRACSRYGPEMLRKFSSNLESNSVNLEFDARSVRLHDAGDVRFTYSLAAMLKRVFRVVKDIRRLGKTPLMVGGEHTFTMPAVMACFRDVEGVLIVFDAHFDLRDNYLGTRMNHATYLRRLLEKRKLKVAVVGVRGYDYDELKTARELGITYYTSKQIHDNLDQVLSRIRVFAGGRPAYVSVDIDVLDPAYAPSVGNPEPNGITPYDLVELLHAVCSPTIVGLDIMEVCSIYDNGLTAAQATRVLVECITAIESKR